MFPKACIVIFKVKNQHPSDIMHFGEKQNPTRKLKNVPATQKSHLNFSRIWENSCNTNIKKETTEVEQNVDGAWCLLFLIFILFLQEFPRTVLKRFRIF